MVELWEEPEHPATLGTIGQATVYVQDSSGEWHDISHYDYFKVKKVMNKPSEFEMKIYDIQDEEKVYFKEQAYIAFFVDNTLILKGRIQDIEYSTAYECIAKGYGLEAELMDKELTQNNNTTAKWSSFKKCFYTNVSAQTIAKELLSLNTDGVAPWIIQPASDGLFSTDFGNVTLVFENVGRLKAISTLCEAMAGSTEELNYVNSTYEWWVSIGGSNYDEHYFHIAPLRPDNTRATTSQYSFTIAGENDNCEKTSREKDISNLVNYITIMGSGDGSSQLVTTTYSASTVFSVLKNNINSSQTSIELADASSFPSSGEIRIAEERVTYTGKAGNTLTGCTRGANGTTARAHKKSVYVEKYVPHTSPEADSSIDRYGLMDYSYVNKGLIDLETMEVMASNTLLQRKDPILTIKIKPSEPDTIVKTLDIGDLVSVEDAEAAISGDYRIIGIEYKSDYGDISCELELSNRSVTFIEQMQKNKDVADSLNVYAQGSSIMNIQTQENGDATHDVNLRYYMPSDVINVSEALLSFKIKNYRSDVSSTQSTSTNGSHSHTVSSHNHYFSDSDNVSISGTTSGPSSTTGLQYVTDVATELYLGCCVDGGTALADIIPVIYSKTVASSSHTHTFSDTDTVNISGYTDSASPGTDSQGNHSHTISTAFGITEVSLSSPYVGVLAGVDEEETCISEQLESGTASGGSSTTLVDASKSWTNNQWQNKMVYIISGTGQGQARIILSNTSNTLTVNAWSIPPNNTSVYRIYDTFSTDQTTIDIKNNIAGVNLVGKWHNIRFVLNQTMRIEANAYIRLFV